MQIDQENYKAKLLTEIECWQHNAAFYSKEAMQAAQDWQNGIRANLMAYEKDRMYAESFANQARLLLFCLIDMK